MSRGTRVGQAYVALTVDGHGINQAIADAVDRASDRLDKKQAERAKKLGKGTGEGFRKGATPEMEKAMRNIRKSMDNHFRLGSLTAGRAGGKALVRHMGKEIQMEIPKMVDPNIQLFTERLGSALKKSKGDFDALSQLMGESFGKELSGGLEKTIKKEIKELSRKTDEDAIQYGRGLASKLRKGFDKDKKANRKMFEKFIEEHYLAKNSDRAGRYAGARLSRKFIKTIQKELGAKGNKEVARAIERTFKMKDRNVFARTLTTSLSRGMRTVGLLSGATLAKWFIKSAGRDTKKGVKKIFGPAFNKSMETALGKSGEKAARSMTRGLTRGMRKVKNPLKKRFDTWMYDLERRPSAAKTIGRIFGMGARNNALNLFGRTVSRVAGMMESASKFAAGFYNAFSLASKAGEGFISAMQMGFKGGSAAAGITEAMAALVASGPMAVAAIAAVIAVLVALVVVLNALLAALAAIAATIASALIGSLAVLGGAFIALAAAGGLAFAAFKSLNEEQKKLLSDSFKPVGITAKSLGKMIANDLTKPVYGSKTAFEVWGANINKALRQAIPLASVMGKAFGDAGVIITKSLSGDGVKLLLDSLTRYLPSITTAMSAALGNFINGLSGMFAAIMPYVQQFAKYLQNVTQRFAEWASSAKGQNSISDFVGRALGSLKSLWNFISSFSGLLGRIFFSSESQKAGNSIFDTLAKKFDELKNKLTDKTLQKWFEDAKETGEAVWDTIQGIKEVLSSMFSEENMNLAITTFKAFGTTVEVVGDIIGWFIDVISDFVHGSLQAFSDFIESVTMIVDGFKDAIQWAKDKVQELGSLFSVFKTDGFQDALNAAAGPLRYIKDLVTDLLGWVGKLASALDKIPFMGPSKFDKMVADVEENVRNYQEQQSQQGAAQKARTDRVIKTVQYNIAMARHSIAMFNRVGSSLKQAIQVAAVAPKWAKAQKQANDEGGGSSGGSSGGGSGGGDSAGGSSGTPKTPEWKNPYVEWAKKFIEKQPSVKKLMKQAVRDIRKSAIAGIREATASPDLSTLKESLSSLISGLKQEGKDAVAEAKSNLSDAATRLANASSKEEAEAAKKEVKKARKALKRARRLNKMAKKANKILKEQRKRSQGNKDSLKGISNAATMANLRKLEKVENNTLADYAKTREKVAKVLENAKEKLANAIQLRDDFKDAISSSIKSYGLLTTAVGKTINGVEQAVTADDILENLETRLQAVKDFRRKLNELVGMGLSDAAYKQLLEAGVEDGAAYVDALVEGGAGAIGHLNDLVGDMDSFADLMGKEASDRMYQAGVDAAQGLVDGLEALADQLDKSAKKLGNSIVKQIKKKLKIKSPSRVMMDTMDDVGDGLKIGLDNQHSKVENAADRLAGQIEISPNAFNMASQMREALSVSRNDQGPVNDIDITVITPTEDPHAVATEAMNELVGRLP